MHRTTLQLEDEIYQQAKALSRRRGVSLRTIINELLAHGLASAHTEPSDQRMKIPLIDDRRPLPGVDIADRSSLFERMEDGSPLR